MPLIPDAPYRKSSHSFANGNCAEVAFRKFRKSSHSQHTVSDPNCPNCVEVGSAKPGQILVRDSKDPRPVLQLTPAQWEEFLASLR